MSVEELLTKVSKHNSSVCACVVSNGDKYHHTLSGNYEVIDPSELIELADNMLVLAETAPELGDSGDTAFVEYENHSVFARRLDEEVLVVLTEPMNMSGFKKVNVGINLFIKPIKKALASDDAAAAPAPAAAPSADAQSQPMVLRADPAPNRTPRSAPPVKAEDTLPPQAAPEAPAEVQPDAEEKPKKKVRYYRGIAY